MAQKDRLSDKKLATMIIESAREIWLAGLSAFERAEKEGGEFFERLVEEGHRVENRARQSADQTFEEVKRSTTGNWDNLERVFEDRVARALKQLGIPTQEDISALSRQVDEIDRRIQQLTEGETPVAKPRRASRAAKTMAGSDPQPARDNLKRIAGIGEALEKKLNAHGITLFRQIARWDDAEIQRIESEVLGGGRFLGRVGKEDWVSQARVQHFEKYREEI